MEKWNTLQYMCGCGCIRVSYMVMFVCVYKRVHVSWIRVRLFVCHVLVFMCASLCVCVCLRMCLRAQVLVLRLRDSVVRLGEELEQSTQSEARERENARYFQQRLQDMRVEMEELSQRQQDSARRRMELVRRATCGPTHFLPFLLDHRTNINIKKNKANFPRRLW